MTQGKFERQYAEEWKRCIINAGADENVAQQAVALAALNGLFDLHRTLAAAFPDGEQDRSSNGSEG